VNLPLVSHKTLTTSSCPNVIGICISDTLGNQSDDLANTDWSSNKWHDIVTKNETLIDFVKHYIDEQYSRETPIFFQWGAQFAVPKENILCHNIEYFKAALVSLDSQSPIEGHYLERVWDLFFKCSVDDI
jgi:hypothetical protein